MSRTLCVEGLTHMDIFVVLNIYQTLFPVYDILDTIKYNATQRNTIEYNTVKYSQIRYFI